MSPRRVFAGHHRDDAGQSLGLLSIDFFNSSVGFRTEQSLAVYHVGQDEIVPVNRPTRNLLVNIDSSYRLADDRKFRHFVLYLIKNGSIRSNSSMCFRQKIFRLVSLSVLPPRPGPLE